VLQVERDASGLIRLGASQYGVAAEVQDREDEFIWRLLQLADGTRDVDAISKSFPGVHERRVRGALDELIAQGFVEDAGAPSPATLCEDEIDRYRFNTEYFGWADTTPRPSIWYAQERVKQSRVTVVGIGGTGSAVAMSLVAAGVGRIRVVDHDVVERSNLNRQMLYSDEDIGRSKAEVAGDRLRRMNPHVNVEHRHQRLSSTADAEELITGEDLLVLSADEPRGQLQYWVNDAALRCRTPWLLCGYAGPMIVLGLFIPFVSACYCCFEHHQRPQREGLESLRPDETDAIRAVIAPTASLCGHFAALEAIYHLAGLGARTSGRMFYQNLMVFDHAYYVDAVRWTGCPSCGG
jgi:molybdopterin/thiamine biosynthesis adenylyltransferase